MQFYEFVLEFIFGFAELRRQKQWQQQKKWAKVVCWAEWRGRRRRVGRLRYLKFQPSTRSLFTLECLECCELWVKEASFRNERARHSQFHDYIIEHHEIMMIWIIGEQSTLPLSSLKRASEKHDGTLGWVKLICVIVESVAIFHSFGRFIAAIFNRRRQQKTFIIHCKVELLRDRLKLFTRRRECSQSYFIFSFFPTAAARSMRHCCCCSHSSILSHIMAIWRDCQTELFH